MMIIDHSDMSSIVFNTETIYLFIFVFIPRKQPIEMAVANDVKISDIIVVLTWVVLFSIYPNVSSYYRGTIRDAYYLLTNYYITPPPNSLHVYLVTYLSQDHNIVIWSMFFPSYLYLSDFTIAQESHWNLCKIKMWKPCFWNI